MERELSKWNMYRCIKRWREREKERMKELVGWERIDKREHDRKTNNVYQKCSCKRTVGLRCIYIFFVYWHGNVSVKEATEKRANTWRKRIAVMSTVLSFFFFFVCAFFLSIFVLSFSFISNGLFAPSFLQFPFYCILFYMLYSQFFFLGFMPCRKREILHFMRSSTRLCLFNGTLDHIIWILRWTRKRSKETRTHSLILKHTHTHTCTNNYNVFLLEKLISRIWKYFLLLSQTLPSAWILVLLELFSDPRGLFKKYRF